MDVRNATPISKDTDLDEVMKDAQATGDVHMCQKCRSLAPIAIDMAGIATL